MNDASQNENGSGQDGYEPPVNLADDVDAIATSDKDGAQAAEAVERQLSTDHPVEEASVSKEGEPVSELLRRTSSLSEAGLIASRATKGEPIVVPVPGPCPGQLVVPDGANPARQLSPESAAVVRQLVAPSTSEDGSGKLSRKSTVAEPVGSKSKKEGVSTRHGSQLTASLPSSEQEDETEDVDDDQPEPVGVKLKNDEEQEARMEQESRSSSLSLSEDDPVTSGTASLSFPTPAQRSAMEQAIKTDETPPIRAEPSQLAAPISPAVADGELAASQSKLSTIPEVPSSLTLAEAQPELASAVLEPTQVENVEMAEAEAGSEAEAEVRPPLVDKTKTKEGAEVGEGMDGVDGLGDSGFFQKPTKAKTDQLVDERCPSPPLVAAKQPPKTTRPFEPESAPTARFPSKPAAHITLKPTDKPNSALTSVAAPSVAAKALSSAPAPFTILASAPRPKLVPVKRPAAVLNQFGPLDDSNPATANVSRPKLVPRTARAIAPTPKAVQASAMAPPARPNRVGLREQGQEKGKGKGKGREKGVGFRERVSQIELQAAVRGDVGEADVDEFEQQFGLGLRMTEDEEAVAKELLNRIFAVSGTSQTLPCLT